MARTSQPTRKAGSKVNVDNTNSSDESESTTRRRKPNKIYAAPLAKVQVPMNQKFVDELDNAIYELNEITEPDYKVTRAHVGRLLFRMYIQVADKIPTESIVDEATFKAALLDAIKKAAK